MSTEIPFMVTITDYEHEMLASVISREDSRKQTRGALGSQGVSLGVAMYQASANPKCMRFSQSTKHQGTKAKKCKRKQQKKNKGGKK